MSYAASRYAAARYADAESFGPPEQDIALPTIDLLTVNAPTVHNTQTVDLPTIDLLTVNAPDAEGSTEQSITLGTIDLLTVNAPTVSNTQTISLPTIDLLTVNAPVVRNPQTVTLGSLALLTENAPTVAFRQAVTLAASPLRVHLNGPKVTLKVAGVPVDPDTGGTLAPLAWKVSTRSAPSTTLATLTPRVTSGSPAGVFDPSWDDILNDIGQWSFNLQNDDPDYAQLVDDRLVTSYIDGDAAFQGVVGPRRRHTVADHPGKFTEFGGPGNLSILADVTIPPTLGDDVLPVEDVVLFGPMRPSFDDSGWQPAVKIATQGLPSIYYTDSPIGSTDETAEWIGPPQGSQADAPEGVWHARWKGAVTTHKHVLFVTADDQVDTYVQGIHMLSTDKTWGIEYWRRNNRIIFDTTTGDLTMYWRVKNNAPTVVGSNPTVLLWSLWTCDDAGNPGTLVAHSNSDTKILPYPAEAPGYTIGAATLELIEATGDPVVPEFDEYVDSNGDPWTVRAELSARVGDDTLWSWLAGLADLDIDVDLTPLLRLRLYNQGGMGRASGVTWTTAAGAAASQIASLDHNRTPATATKLRVRWARGRFTLDSGATPVRERALNLGHIQSRTEAERLAQKELDRLSVARVQAELVVEPVGSADKPYVAVRKGDTVTVSPNESGGSTLERNVGFNVTADELGNPIFRPRVRNRLLEIADRLGRIFSRMSPGGVGGDVASASTATPVGVVTSVVIPDILKYSIGDDDAAIPADYATAEEPVRVAGTPIRWTVRLTRDPEIVADGDTTVLWQLNGTTLGTVTIADTDVRGTMQVEIDGTHILNPASDYARMVVDGTAGDGVTGIVGEVEVI